MKLTFDELVEGKVYITIEKGPDYMFLKTGDCRCIPYTDPSQTYHTGGHLSSIGNSSFTYYKEADNLQTLWMKECIKAGKTISKPITNDYYNIGDWLINDLGEIPKAMKCIALNKEGHYIVNAFDNSYYDKNCKGLRLATWDEIPEEYRFDILHPTINNSYSIF